MGAERVFRMRAPNGDVAEVPERDVDHYRKKGAVVVESVRTPERASWLANQIDQPSTTRSVPMAMMRGFVAPYAQAGADLLEGAKAGAMSTIYNGGDLIRRGWNTISPASMQADRLIENPDVVDAMTPPDSWAGRVGFYGEQGAEYIAPSARALNMASKIAPAVEVGGAMMKNPSLMRRAAAAGTLMGADAAWAGVQSGGDPTTMAVGAVAPPIISGAMKGAARGAKALQRAASAASEEGFGAGVANMVRNVAPEDPKTMIVQAVKPRNSQVKFDDAVGAVAPRIKQVADDMGLPLDNIDNVLTATRAAKRVVRDAYESVMRPMGRMGVNLSSVADQQIAAIPRSLAIENPAAYRKAVARANAWRRVASVEEVDTLLRETNAQLEGYYAKFPQSQRKALLADPRIASINAKAEALRSVRDAALDHPELPTSVRDVSRLYGQMMEFEDSLLRRRNVAKRQQPMSLAEQVAEASGFADRAAGVFKMGRSVFTGDTRGAISGAADMVRGQARRAMGKYLKETQTTDALLRRAFERIEPSAPMPTYAPRSVAGLIERGSIPMAAAPDGSYVRSVPAEPARREVAGYLPSSTTASRQFEMPPSSEAAATVDGVAADRVVQRDPRTGQMQRVYTGEEAGTAKQRAGSPYTPVLSFLPNAAAQAIPEDPESDWDNYARTALNLGGVVAMGSTFGPKFKEQDVDPSSVRRQILRSAKFLNATMGDARARAAAKFLTPAELESQMTSHARGNMQQMSRARAQMPSVDELASAVVGGRDKRGWYENSRRALEHVFGDDADLFAGVLAATSPQNSVESNLQNSLRIYRNWNAAGRPTDENAILKIMAKSVNGMKGEESVLDAWKNNTVSVLSGGNVISGPKVDSFWTNLRSRARRSSMGDVHPDDAVTLDAWMANLFGIDNAAFAGRTTKAGSPAQLAKFAKGDPGYSPKYLAGSSLVRETAQKLGLKPSEVQETAWSFGKALYEKAEALGISAREVVERGLLTPQDISGTVDFSLLLKDPTYANLLAPEHVSRVSSLMHNDLPRIADATPAQQQWMRKAADRLDEVRARRALDSRYRTGENAHGRVIASLPIEAATPPTNRSRVGPSGFGPGQTEKMQDNLSSELLGAGEDLATRGVIEDAVFPGNTGSVRRGYGDYMGQHNVLRTTPVEVRLKANETIPDADERGLRFASGMKSAMVGQDAAVVTAIDFNTNKPHDAVRVTTPNKVPRSGLDAIRAALPEGEWAVQHRSDGLDVLKLNGAMTNAEAKQVMDVVRQQVPLKSSTTNRGADAANEAERIEKMMPAKSGRNVISPDTAYRELPWGDVGSKDVTRWLAADYYKLPASTRRRLDGKPVRQFAQDLFERYSKDKSTRPDHLNVLRIVADKGISGLMSALDDPKELFPILAGVGLLGAMTRASGPPTNRQERAQ